jgi:hypothetical protein
MKPFGMTTFLLFSMAVRVNNQQDENNEPATYQDDEYRAVLPNRGHKVTQVRNEISIHPLSTYAPRTIKSKNGWCRRCFLSAYIWLPGVRCWWLDVFPL